MVAILAVLVVGLVVAAVVLARSASSACGYPAPANTNLPAALRSLGGYDQPMDAANVAALQSASVTAATELHPDLIGVAASSPVSEAPQHGGPAAVVVPLRRTAPTGAQVVGLVAYLSDCAGRLYFDSIEDLSDHPMTSYPATRMPGAHLVFNRDPFAPFSE